MEVKEPPFKRTKTNGFSGKLNMVEERLGSNGLIRKSEFIRLITDALNSLGYEELGSRLEKESGISLHDEITNKFLKQVKDREWDKSIDTLKQFSLRDEKAAKFLLLEQKFFDSLKIEEDPIGRTALNILRSEMVPLGVNTKRVHELSVKLIVPPGEDIDSRSKVVEKLQKLFPSAVIIPERSLENLLEDTLKHQRRFCYLHNIPDSELSLCSDHVCGSRTIPSKNVQTLEAHTDEVWFLKFSHNGKYLASSSKDKSAIIWEINAEGNFSQKHQLLGHQNPVVAVLWSPDDTQVLTCGENEVIRRWDVDSGAFLQLYGRTGVGSVSCGWFHDGSGIIGGMSDRCIYSWKLDGTEVQYEQGQRTQNISDVAMTHDGKWLVSVGREHEISLFDRKTSSVERVIEEEDMITSFSLSKDSNYLLITLTKEKIHLWDIEEEVPYKISEFTGHKRRQSIIRSCFGGYNDNFIASGSEDCQVYIWQSEWMESEFVGPCAILPGHTGAVKCVSWNPTDIHVLASASDDRTIRIWGLDKNLN